MTRCDVCRTAAEVRFEVSIVDGATLSALGLEPTADGEFQVCHRCREALESCENRTLAHFSQHSPGRR